MVAAQTASMMIDSVCMIPYLIRSQKRTYASDSAKKTIVIATNKASCIALLPQACCGLEHHHDGHVQRVLGFDQIRREPGNNGAGRTRVASRRGYAASP